MKNFKHCKDLVSQCLKEFPETRGSDKELLLRVWDMQGFRIPKKLYGLWFKVHSPETITRCRRDIQGTGLYAAEPQETAQRSLQGMRYRQYFRENK